jgi:surface antigen/FtsZ-binding cell division protein ZapB
MSDSLTLKQTRSKSQKVRNLALSVMCLGITLSVCLSAVASADQFDQKINELRAANNNLQGERSQLQSEANDLQSTIDGLQSQISTLENQIRDNENRRNDLLRQIAETEAEIARQRDLLGQNIRAMYLENDMSTFEMLASTNDLSDFVDREQYRISVEDKIQTALEKIKALQETLNAQKAEVEKLLADQKNIQGQLNSQRAEQARLLSLNAAERGALDSQIRANSGQMAQLRRQQAVENMRLFRGGVRNVPDSTGYPWASAPFPNTIADPWGMYKRQCVSYTAWKVYKSGRHMPYWGGHGNANQWDENARAAGIPVDGNPRIGDVAVSNKGVYGHVMYVEAVYGDGTIYISQYNAGWDGRYSEARVSTSGLVFIHF